MCFCCKLKFEKKIEEVGINEGFGCIFIKGDQIYDVWMRKVKNYFQEIKKGEKRKSSRQLSIYSFFQVENFNKMTHIKHIYIFNFSHDFLNQVKKYKICCGKKIVN